MRMIASAAALLVGLLAAGCNGEVVGGGQRPAKVLVVSGDLQTGTVGQELAQPLVVQVVDDGGKPVRDQLVNFVVTAGGGSVFAGAAITNAEGEARERWTLGTVAGDTQRVEARAVDPATGEKLVFATFRAVAQAGAPSSITPVTAQVTGLAGLPVADSVAALVRDAYGNPVSGAQVAWSVTGGGGSVSPAASATNAQGVARAQWTLGGSLSAQTLQAAAGVSLTTTFTANAGLGSATTLTRVSGEAQSAPVGTQLAQPLVVEVRQNGVAVVGAQVVWAPAPGMGSATPATSVTDAQGRASTSWTLGSGVGTQTLAAQVQGGAGVVFFSATATAGAPASLEVVAPPSDANPAYGGRDTLYVRVRDASGNLVPNATVSWTVINGGGGVTAQSVTGADGVASAVWQLGGTVNTQGVSASIAGLDPVLYHWYLVNSRPAATFAAVGGGGQTVPLWATVDHGLVVRLTDAEGRGIYGAPVEWTSPNGVVTVEATDQEGYSRLWPSVQAVVGPQTVTARTQGMPDVTFTLNAVPGPANGLRMGRDTLLELDEPGDISGIPFVIYDSVGQPIPLEPFHRFGAASPRLLDSTGVIALEIGGHNIRSHVYRTLGYGSERIEMKRPNGAADTVTVHVRERTIQPGVMIGTSGVPPYPLEVGGTARANTFITVSEFSLRGARQVTWSSSNSSVATVDAEGVITAVGPGIAAIRADGLWGGMAIGYVLVKLP
jgi:hypothetical protein